jgi:hypothetical protein
LGAGKTERSSIVIANVGAKRLGMTEAEVANSVDLAGQSKIQGGQRGEAKSTTDGGCAKGIPRNLFVPLAVVPVNRPLSSETIGPVAGVGEEAAKTVAAAAQIVISDTRRKPMGTKEDDLRVPRGTCEL